MKIINGFVSNSSSSSFIVRFDERYPNTLAIAESMFKNRFSDWRDYDKENEYFPREERAFKNIEKLKGSKYENMPMYFRSTNYDTYIKAISEKFAFVDTCNNIHWDIKDEPNTTFNAPPEIMELYPDTINDYNELEIRIKYDTEYYILESGLIAKSPREYDTCKKCYDPMWFIGTEKYCTNCDGEKISRSLKINKVKKLIAKSK
jgi:hypothetical protein